jgi:hypothetical protein
MFYVDLLDHSCKKYCYLPTEETVLKLNTSCEVCGSCSIIPKDSCHLEYDTVLFYEFFWDLLTLEKIKNLHPFKTLGTTHTTQLHISED